jgi:hypothetical protein
MKVENYQCGFCQMHVGENHQPQCLVVQMDRLYETERLYSELLYAVGNKYEGETRHQTALRYIRAAETFTDCVGTGAAHMNKDAKNDPYH